MKILGDEQTFSGYRIELSENPKQLFSQEKNRDLLELVRSLLTTLHSIGAGARTYVSSETDHTLNLELHLTCDKAEAFVDERLSASEFEGGQKITFAETDFDADRHEEVLSILQAHPLVRRIRLPIGLRLSNMENEMLEKGDSESDTRLNVTAPNLLTNYPIVGVIDSGISKVQDQWVTGCYTHLENNQYDTLHGTEVAGLICVPQLVNGSEVAYEENGCRLYDTPLFPKTNSKKIFPNGFRDFLAEAERAIAVGREKYNVRVFNLSINVGIEVEFFSYSEYAAKLDEISDRYDVIIVNSVGNLQTEQFRSPWPRRTIDVIRYFAERVLSDSLSVPAESVRAVSVGAINPPGTDQIAGVPTIYTRRGPGFIAGLKPDVVSYGGVGRTRLNEETGLSSISFDGRKKFVSGTSYSAPLVSRTLAELNTRTNDGLSTEALKAMLLHHSYESKKLRKRGIGELSKQFTGFGQPISARGMLEVNDHQFTMVFQSSIKLEGRKPVILRFPFEWPASLVENGACSGTVKVTLVYSPPLDTSFGVELIRAKLEARLSQKNRKMQGDRDSLYLNQMKSRFSYRKSGKSYGDAAVIDHGLKWWPCKQYERNLNRRGDSAEWRLDVVSQVRAEAPFPVSGIPFSVILTLEDPNGESFREMQQILNNYGAVTRPIQNATRVRPRI